MFALDAIASHTAPVCAELGIAAFGRVVDGDYKESEIDIPGVHTGIIKKPVRITHLAQFLSGVDSRPLPSPGSCLSVASASTAVGVDQSSTVATSSSPQTDCEQPSRSKLRIMIVDDMSVNQKVMAQLVKRIFAQRGTDRQSNLEIVLCSNGQEAVDQAKQGHWSLIFMDLMMPVLDGLEATKQIRAQESASQQQEIPIVGVTADSNAVESCLASGMSRVLIKPVALKDLAETMDSLLLRG